MIRSADAYRRLVTAHDDDEFYWTPEFNRLLDFRTDQQHTFWGEMIAFDRAIRQYPVLNAEFGYERGVEDFPTYRVKQDWEEQLNHPGWCTSPAATASTITAIPRGMS